MKRLLFGLFCMLWLSACAGNSPPLPHHDQEALNELSRFAAQTEEWAMEEYSVEETTGTVLREKHHSEVVLVPELYSMKKELRLEGVLATATLEYEVHQVEDGSFEIASLNVVPEEINYMDAFQEKGAWE